MREYYYMLRIKKWQEIYFSSEFPTLNATCQGFSLKQIYIIVHLSRVNLFAGKVEQNRFSLQPWLPLHAQKLDIQQPEYH